MSMVSQTLTRTGLVAASFLACFGVAGAAETPSDASLRQAVRTGAITVATGTASLDGSAIVLKRPLTVRVAAGAALHITAPLEIPTLIKEGLGTLFLDGDKRFAGAVTVQEGALVINSAATLAPERCRIRALPGVVVGFGHPIVQQSLDLFADDIAAAFTIALAADSDADLDVGSNPGLARASLGAIGQPVFSGRLAPAEGVYRLGGGDGTLTMTKPLDASRPLIVGGFFAPHGRRICWPTAEAPPEFPPPTTGAVVLPADSSVPARTMIINGELRLGRQRVPPAPTSLAASRLGLRKIQLTWHAIDGAETHVVELAADDGPFKERLRVSGTARDCVIDDLPERATVALRVRAVVGSLTSVATNAIEIETRPAAPPAPDLLRAIGGYTWVDLEWRSGGSNFGTVVERSADGTSFAEVNRVPAGVTRTSVRIQETGTSFFRVAGLDADGRPGAWSNVMSAATDAAADVETNLRRRFGLDTPERRYDPDRPALMPTYDDAQKQAQRRAGEQLLRDVHEQLRSNATVRIPPGVYRVPGDAFRIENVEHVTVEAAGVTFVMEGSRRGALFRMIAANDVTIRGPLTITLDVPMWSATRVLAASADESLLDVEVLPGYSRQLEPKGECFLFDAGGRMLAEVHYKNCESLEGRQYRVRGWRGSTDGWRLAAVRAADVPAFMPVSFGRGPRNQCRDITFENIECYGMNSMAASFGGHLTFVNFRGIPQPGTSQLFAGQPGQFGGRDAVLVMDGCEFTTGGDDGINLLGTSGLAEAMTAPDTVTICRLVPRVGEQIVFHDFRTGACLGEARITSTSEGVPAAALAGCDTWLRDNRCGKAGSKSACVATLDRPVRIGWYAQAFLPESGCRDLVVRNCHWKDMNAQAVLAQTCRQALIADTLFERCTAQAIHLNASSYWMEGYWPNNVTIRNNVIRDNTPGPNRFSAPSVEAGWRPAVPGQVRGLIENCTIEGNTIVNSAYAAIMLNYGRNCSIVGNTIIDPGICGGEAQAAVVIRGGEDVVVRDNVVRFEKQAARPWLEVSPDTVPEEITVEGNLVVVADGTVLDADSPPRGGKQ